LLFGSLVLFSSFFSFFLRSFFVLELRDGAVRLARQAHDLEIVGSNPTPAQQFLSFVPLFLCSFLFFDFLSHFVRVNDRVVYGTSLEN
jgi:hypothetical protein